MNCNHIRDAYGRMTWRAVVPSECLYCEGCHAETVRVARAVDTLVARANEELEARDKRIAELEAERDRWKGDALGKTRAAQPFVSALKERIAEREARLRVVAQLLRDHTGRPNDGPKSAEDYAREIVERIAELEAAAKPGWFQSALADTGDYSLSCRGCGAPLGDDEEHAWTDCLDVVRENAEWGAKAEVEARLREATEWRPIDTAPYDTRVLVLTTRSHIEIAARSTSGIWDPDGSMSLDYAPGDLAGWLPLPGGAS